MNFQYEGRWFIIYINLNKMFFLEPGVEYDNGYFYAGIRVHKIKVFYNSTSQKYFYFLYNYVEILYNGIVEATHVAVTFASLISFEFGTVRHILILQALMECT